MTIDELAKQIDESIEGCGEDYTKLISLAKILKEKYYTIRAKVILAVDVNLPKLG